MLTRTHIRRPVAGLLVALGGIALFLAPETWPGVALLVAGIAIELIGISLKK